MASKDHDLIDTGITFASGAAYGMTTVAVGQPFHTIKTVVQSSGEGTVAATRKVIAESGVIKGLWRGSLPLVLGGTFMRSAQFGCNDLARDALRDSSIPSFKIGGVVESHIVLAGMCGGLGRAVVEGPTEFFKIRQQIVAKWSYREALSGLGVTMGRNTGLFSAFVVYMDLLRPYLGDSPFVYGATCSNLAWLTVWPFDVVKTQRQSGRHPGVSAPALLANAFREGALFRGLLPGLVRSSIANGTSMVVYKRVHAELSRLAGRDDHSNI